MKKELIKIFLMCFFRNAYHISALISSLLSILLIIFFFSSNVAMGYATIFLLWSCAVFFMSASGIHSYRFCKIALWHFGKNETVKIIESTYCERIAVKIAIKLYEEKNPKIKLDFIYNTYTNKVRAGRIYN